MCVLHTWGSLWYLCPPALIVSHLSHTSCVNHLSYVVLCCFSSSHTVWRRIHSLRLLLASESAIPSWFINLSKLCELHPRLVFDLLERIHIVQKSSINTDRVRFYTFRWKLLQMSSTYSFIMKWTRLLTLDGVLFSYKSSPANASAHEDICDVILWCVCVCVFKHIHHQGRSPASRPCTIHCWVRCR